MSIQEQWKQIATAEIEELRWAKGLEFVEVAGSEGRPSDCTTGLHKATRLHKAKECTTHPLKQEVHGHFSGEDYEPYEMVYSELYASQLPTVERAL